MKTNFLFPAALLITLNCSSQITSQKKQVEQAKITSRATPVLANPTGQQNTAAKTATTTNNNVLTAPINKKADSASAILSHASFVVTTARSYNEEPGTNKAADTHWSCTLFDANGRQVASFSDDSNTDEYIAGSQTPALGMHADNTAAFGDFSKGGRLHISIAPSGNDTWVISVFDLSLGFSTPNFTNHVSWSGIRLTQDSREIDLYFNQQSSATPKYDVKANKKS